MSVIQPFSSVKSVIPNNIHVQCSTVQRDTEARSDLCMLICPLSSYGCNSSNAINCCEGKNVPTNAHSGHTLVSVRCTSIHRMEMVFIRVLSGTHSAAMTSVITVDSMRHIWVFLRLTAGHTSCFIFP